MILNALAVVILIAIDQITKKIAAFYLAPDKTFPIIDGILHFTYVENDGAAFSILKGYRWFFVIFTGIAIAAIIIHLILKKPGNFFERAGLVLIIAGGLGNFIDRFRFGYVVDMVDFRAINYAIFNFADSCVVVGVILWGIYLLFLEKNHLERKKKKNERAYD